MWMRCVGPLTGCARNCESAGQPARCRNSVLTLAHEPIWRMEEADLVSLLKKKLSKPRREQALTRLAEVRSATVQFNKMRENA